MPPQDASTTSPPSAPVQPIAPQPQTPPQMPMRLNPAFEHDKLATASLILGIVSLPASILNVLALPIPVTGIVLGLVSLKRNKSFAIAGIVLSLIGIVLSVVVLVVGQHLLHKRAPSNSGLDRTQDVRGVNGSEVTSNCYTFSLPPVFTATDVTKNDDCSTEVITRDSTDDILVNSTDTAATVSPADTDAFLKNFSAEAERSIGDKGQITSKSFITLDGVRAYKATGTENYGQYKYLGYIVALAPRDYLSVTGAKLRAFIIVYDSATSQDRLNELIKSWHWQ